MRRRVLLQTIGIGAAFAAAPRIIRAAGPDEIKVGNPQTISDAPLFIAEHKGYLKEQNIQVNFVNMATAAYMIAPLGAGQLDIAAGASSAALFNSAARGIGIKIVADKGSNLPGYAYISLLVRKDLVDSGKFQTMRDLKGLRVAEPGKGNATGSIVNEALKSVGLAYDDVTHVYNMGFPEMVGALQSQAIDAAITPEPFNTQAREQGGAVRYASDAFYPTETIAVIMYGNDFIAKRRDVGQRFMTAYLQAVRFYNGAIKDGHFAGPNAGEVIAILTKETRYKDPALYRKIVPNGCNPDGRVDRPSMEKDLAFFREQKFIEGEITVANVIDESFLDAALKTLGPYKPA